MSRLLLFLSVASALALQPQPAANEAQPESPSPVFNITLFFSSCLSNTAFAALGESVYLQNGWSMTVNYWQSIPASSSGPWFQRSINPPFPLGYYLATSGNEDQVAGYFTLDSGGCYWAAFSDSNGFQNGIQMTQEGGGGSCDWQMLTCA